MNVVRCIGRVTAAVVATMALSSGLHAQYTAGVARLVAEPARVTMRAGETVPLKITAYDSAGKVVADAPLRVGGPRESVRFADGQLTALRAGSFKVTATAFAGRGIASVALEIPVTVSWPTLTTITIAAAENGKLYTGTMLAHVAKGAHADGTARPGLSASWRTSDAAIATVDRFGNVTGVKPGAVTISATAEGVTAEKRYTVAASPVARIETGIRETTVNTGDVVHLMATPRRANGEAVNDAKVDWSFVYTPDDTTAAPGGPGMIDRAPDGTPLFTANAPGRFTLIAQSGTAMARTVLDVKPRDVRRRISITGRGIVNTTATSDLWPWTGQGRARLLPGRHVGRRRLRSGLRHHRPQQHRQDRLDQDRRAHDQRRDRLARRALRRARRARGRRIG